MERGEGKRKKRKEEEGECAGEHTQHKLHTKHRLRKRGPEGGGEVLFGGGGFGVGVGAEGGGAQGETVVAVHVVETDGSDVGS